MTRIPAFNTTTHDPDILFVLSSASLLPSEPLSFLHHRHSRYFIHSRTNTLASYQFWPCPLGSPVLACDSGGPTESIVDGPPGERTGWLRTPEAHGWAAALIEIAGLSPLERYALADRARARAREYFGMEVMALKLEWHSLRLPELGPVPTPVALWFGSFIAVALFAYFMATIYTS